MGGGGPQQLVKKRNRDLLIFTLRKVNTFRQQKGRGMTSPPARGTFGTADTQPIPAHALKYLWFFLKKIFLFGPFIKLACINHVNMYITSALTIHAILGGGWGMGVGGGELVNTEAKDRQTFTTAVS